jgi:hypothetical protein
LVSFYYAYAQVTTEEILGISIPPPLPSTLLDYPLPTQYFRRIEHVQNLLTLPGAINSLTLSLSIPMQFVDFEDPISSQRPAVQNFRQAVCQHGRNYFPARNSTHAEASFGSIHANLGETYLIVKMNSREEKDLHHACRWLQTHFFLSRYLSCTSSPGTLKAEVPNSKYPISSEN